MFTSHKETCLLVILNNLRIPQAEDAKYLRPRPLLHLDHRLNWKKTYIEGKQLGFFKNILDTRH